jgi:glycosyltransferase involved in cell wall biosynthesis
LRFLLINHEYTVSGASLLMLRLAQHLVDRGHSCDVMAILAHDGPLRARYAAHGIRHRITADFKNYDAAIVNTIFAAPIVPLAEAFTKTIWWIHEGENGLHRVRDSPADRGAFEHATAIVFQTTHQRTSIYRDLLGDRERVFVVPVGIDVPVSGPIRAKTLRFRIVSIGTIDRRKRHSDLVRAVAALGRDDVECAIIGPYFWLEEDARRIAAERPDRFKILEAAHDETLAWLRSADLFCLPSESESQPLSALEAAALGKPLVLTDLPSYRGIWRHDENCLLVPVGDLGAISSALAALLSSADLRERLGIAAQATAGQFTEAAFFARFDEMLETIVRASRRDPADRSSA